MTQPMTLLRSKRPLSSHPRGPFSRPLTSHLHVFHPKTPVEGPDVPGQSNPSPLEFHRSHSTSTDPGALCEHLVGLVSNLRPLLPAGCGWLEQGSIEVVGEHPVDGGGVADLWVGRIGNRKVAIKAYRYDSSSNCSVAYTRFHNEVLACSRLNEEDVVPFIGLYSTLKHPLALVFEFMDHLNLREYLRSDLDAGRRELLTGIARGVEHMHKLNVVHGNLKITNILVDARGRARVAGLGVASPLSAVPGVEIDRFFHGAAPELADPQRFGLTDTGATMPSDIYAFGVLAWEIFARQAPFSEEGGVAGIYSMLSGRRPPRPDHPELSDPIWEMINGCWECVPSRRRTITEAIAVLNAELNHY